MNNSWRIVIVGALVAVVVAVVVIKQRDKALTDTGNSASRPAVASAPLPRLLDIGSTTCIPCRMMAPILEELRKEYAGRMEVVFIDISKNREAGDRYGIQGIPTQIFYDASGKELSRHDGFISKADILARWKELGVDFARAPQ